MKLRAFLDTGADRTLMSHKVYESYFEHWPLKKPAVGLKSVTGETVECNGVVNILMDAGSGIVQFHEFYVVPRLRQPVLLGNSFFNDFNRSMN